MQGTKHLESQQQGRCIDDFSNEMDNSSKDLGGKDLGGKELADSDMLASAESIKAVDSENNAKHRLSDITNTLDNKKTTAVSEISVKKVLPSAVCVGAVLNDRYLLQALLGEGGMGTVYKALDLRREEVHDPSPHVAIKLLNENIRRVTGAVMALQREAVVAQTLKHTGIASVYDYNRDESHAYIVMELIDGYTLDQLIISDYPEGLPSNKSFKLISELIETVLFSHDKGVVHADIKPSNIKILPNGDAKIMDFGLARVMSLLSVSQSSTDNNVDPQWSVSALGNAITPSYATRARLKGRQPIKVDDTYALGCVIYLILTGRHPYQRMTAEKAIKIGVIPEKPSCLTKKQWRVLQGSLDPNIDKESELLKALSISFCPRRRGVKKTKRKVYAVITLLCFLLATVPVIDWLNNVAPVWEIRFSDSEITKPLIEKYVSDRTIERDHALEKIALPILLKQWADRWNNEVTLFSQTLVEQHANAHQLQYDLAIAELLTPSLSQNESFSDQRKRLEQVRADYVIKLLNRYEKKLTTYLTKRKSVTETELFSLYNDYQLLLAVEGTAHVIFSDPRLRVLFYREIRQEWENKRYFPLGEKLQLAKAFFPENRGFGKVMEHLNKRVSLGVRALDIIEVIEADDIPQWFLGEISNENTTISLNYRPVLKERIKALLIASSNKLDVNPVYRDRFESIKQNYFLYEGNNHGWQQLLRDAQLSYGRELVKWGQVKEAYAVVDEMITKELFSSGIR